MGDLIFQFRRCKNGKNYPKSVKNHNYDLLKVVKLTRMFDFNLPKVTKITKATYTKLLTATRNLLDIYVSAET